MWNVEVGKNPVLIAELKGHLRAVTSVDWQTMKDGNEYLVSCSDDLHIRVYTVKNDVYELIHNIDTKFINDWHTLTYLALEEVSIIKMINTPYRTENT